MIQFIYEHPKGNDYEGKIVVSIDETAAQYYKKEQFPLRLMHKTLSKHVHYRYCELAGMLSEVKTIIL